jgi:hypothetical protein
MFDRADVVVGNCARGDPVWEKGRPVPGLVEVQAALVERLSWCEVPRAAAARMLDGYERAFPFTAARARAATADAAAAASRMERDPPN